MTAFSYTAFHEKHIQQGIEYVKNCHVCDPIEPVGIPTTPQCTHEDMNCPPGECEDLYPPHREDMGR